MAETIILSQSSQEQGTANDPDFRKFLQNETVSIFLHSNVALILLLLVSYLNVVKSGTSLAWAPYIPVFLLLLIVQFWHECSPATLIKSAHVVLDCICLAGVLGATAIALIFQKLEVETLNAPVQIALAVACAFTLYPRRSHNLLRNFLITSAAFGAMYYFNRDYAVRIVTQYPVGFLLGSFGSHYLLQSRRGQYQEVIHARSRETHALRQLQKMVLPHQMERISVGDELESTMPVSVGNTYIIKFDVVSSSTIRHDGFIAALHDVFSECYAVMQEHYRHVPLQANGYPVKWLGDGFLCSVGFPLAVPHGISPADLSDSLAERFCRIFHRHMATLRYHRRICCSQGIARGTIEGFYAEGGPKLYDLRSSFSDDPLMLATRYEQLRKFILQELGQSSSIVVLSEKVYTNLSSERRGLYTCWDISATGHSITEDPSAHVAYYRLVSHPHGT